MVDANQANLDTLYKECQNDSRLFLATIAKFLQSKDFFVGDYQQILSETFANAAKNSNVDEQQQQQQQAAHNHSADTLNGKTNGAPELNDDNSCDLFDDDIIPETQDFPHDSNDSGESVRIPFYNRPIFSESPDANDSDDTSDYVRIRPESNLPDSMGDDELQSQFIMANVEPNLIRDIEMSETNNGQTTNALSSTRAADPIEANLGTGNAPNDNSSDKHCVDRSGSTTPDLDFLDGKEKEQESHASDHNDTETQMFSENIFDACTQQVSFTRAESPKQTSTDDIFAADTQVPIFKLPKAICSTPLNAAKPKSLAMNVSIFDADTQRVEENDDIFEAATQNLPLEKSSSAKKAKSVFDADTQRVEENDDIFEEATQRLPLGKPSSTKKAARIEQPEPEETTNHNESDDLFGMETQIFEAPGATKPVSAENNDPNESDIFGMATQMIDEPDDLPTVQTKRIPAVVTQLSQPANTPEWSMAARLSNAEIEQFEKQLAESEAAKKKQKLKKHRFLFATSSDEEDQDDDDDDLDFDIAKPQERIRVTTVAPAKEIEEEEIEEVATLKRVSSNQHDKEVPAKKPKPNDVSSATTAKILARRVSVKLSREEVRRHIAEDEAAIKPKKVSRLASKTSKAVETKPAKVDAPEQRSLRQKKTDSPTVEVRQSKRTKKQSSCEDEEAVKPKGKKHTEEEKRKARVSPRTNSKTRNPKKDNDRSAKENGKSPSGEMRIRKLRSRTVSISA